MHQHLWVAHRGDGMGNNQLAWNRRMNVDRTSAEWGFGKVTQLWGYLDHKQQQKLLLQPLGKHYTVAVIMTNIHTILYGSVTTAWLEASDYMPTLVSYLNV